MAGTSFLHSSWLAWFGSRIAETGGTRGKPFWSSGAAAVVEMLLPQEPGSRDNAALGPVHMDKLGDVPEHTLYRHPDLRIEPRIESSVFGLELCFPAAIVSHPHPDHARRAPRSRAFSLRVVVGGRAVGDASSSIPW